MSRPLTILFAGGGTGGHLYPAIAIAEEIQRIKPETRFVFAGTKKKIEARVVPQKGYEFYPLWISGFHRRMKLRNILFPLKVIVSLLQSFFLIRKVKPQAVIGTGGYVCGPVLFAASFLGIPTAIHESNSFPGVTTRLLAGRVNKVFITFEITKQWLKKTSTAELLGNPTREILSSITREKACAELQLSPAKKTLFAFGGSLGAQSINRAMPKIVSWAVENDIQVIWQTGESDWSSLPMVQHHPNIKLMKYIEHMEFSYAASDVVISRAGATTLAELTRVGKPAILIPYPHAAANHQFLNAKTMVESGAAVLIDDKELDGKLLNTVQQLISDDQALERMSEKSKELGRPNAGKEIAEKILSMIKN